MKVAISVAGTWHAPHLAYQLQKRGMLEKVFTTIPKNRFCRRNAIDPQKIDWVLFPELLGTRIPGTLGLSAQHLGVFTNLHAESFDRIISHKLHNYSIDILTVFARFGVHSLRICKRLGIRTVLERGSCHALYRESLLREEYERLELLDLFPALPRIVLKRELLEYDLADYIAVPSEFAYSSFVEMGISKVKLIKTPYGVDTRLFQPASERKTSSRFRILSVGNLGVEKGTGYLIDAMDKVGSTSVELILVGSLDQYAKARIAKMATEHKFLGKVDHLKLPEIYNSVDVFCLPSIQEGQSMAMLEAMACGLPVIVSAHTGGADIIKEGVNGFVVPVRDPDAIAARLSMLRDNAKLRLEMGAQARVSMMNKSWSVYGDVVTERYNNIMTPLSSGLS